MIQKLAIFLVIFVIVIFQVSVLPSIFPEKAVPDLVLMTVIIWTMRGGFESILARTVLSGFLLDLASFWPAGLNVLSFVVVSFGISFLTKRFLAIDKLWKSSMLAAFVIAGTVADNLIVNAIFQAYNHLGKEKMQFAIISFADYHMIFKILFNLMIVAIIYIPLKKLDEIMSFYSERSLNQRRSFQRR